MAREELESSPFADISITRGALAPLGHNAHSCRTAKTSYINLSPPPPRRAVFVPDQQEPRANTHCLCWRASGDTSDPVALKSAMLQPDQSGRQHQRMCRRSKTYKHR